MTRHSEKVTSFLPLQRSISIHGHSKDYIAGRVTFTLPLPGIRTYCLWLVYSDVNCYSSLYVEGDHAFRPYLRMKINHKYLEMKIKNQTTTEVGGPVLYSLTINTYALCFNPTFMKTSKTKQCFYIECTKHIRYFPWQPLDFYVKWGFVHFSFYVVV